jgi:hypothetical protein
MGVDGPRSEGAPGGTNHGRSQRYGSWSQGRAIGVDMTREMVDAAGRNSDQMGFVNVSLFLDFSDLARRRSIDSRCSTMFATNFVIRSSNELTDRSGRY